MNRTIVRELGISSSGRRFGFFPDERIPAPAKAIARSLISEARRRQVRSLLQDPPWRSSHRMQVIRWGRYEELADRHAARLRALAGERSASKDPTFCWTLGVWCAAGAPIDHVVITIRSLDAMAQSRVAQNWLSHRSLGGIKNWFAYGFGLLMSAVVDYRLSSGIARFPDFLSQPEDLYHAIKFPHPVSYERFLTAFHHHVKPQLVHDQR
jgi:hypothetical protein